MMQEYYLRQPDILGDCQTRKFTDIRHLFLCNKVCFCIFIFLAIAYENKAVKEASQFCIIMFV